MGQTNVKNLGNGGTMDGDVTITGDLTVSGGIGLSLSEVIEGTSTIDVDSGTALVVRKNGDSGDILTVNTTNGIVTIKRADAVTNPATDTNAGLLIENTNASGSAILRMRGGDGAARIMYGENNSTDKLYISPRNEAANFGVIDQIGQLGIGETSPDSLLHLKSTSASKPILKIENEQGGANPVSIQMLRNTSSPADDDFIGQIDFRSMNDAGTPEEILYAYISAQSTDITDGTEDGEMNFHTMKAGTLTNTLELKSGNATFAGGLVAMNRSQADESLSLAMYSTVDGHMPALLFKKSASNTIGTASATGSGDVLGQIVFQGHDTDNDVKAGAIIRASADAAPDGDSVPTKLQFMTSDLDDSGSPTVAMTIDDGQNVGIGTVTPTHKL